MIIHLLFPVFKSNECLQVKEGIWFLEPREKINSSLPDPLRRKAAIQVI